MERQFGTARQGVLAQPLIQPGKGLARQLWISGRLAQRLSHVVGVADGFLGVLELPEVSDEDVMRELRVRFKGEVVALSEYLGRDLVNEWGYDRVE